MVFLTFNIGQDGRYLAVSLFVRNHFSFAFLASENRSAMLLGKVIKWGTRGIFYLVMRTPDVYAIELLELPNEIPIAWTSAGACSPSSTALISFTAG